jgi:hypothetical protein
LTRAVRGVGCAERPVHSRMFPTVRPDDTMRKICPDQK